LSLILWTVPSIIYFATFFKKIQLFYNVIQVYQISQNMLAIWIFRILLALTS
jgi:hypothetical protein